jgi:WD40 repeat protein
MDILPFAPGFAITTAFSWISSLAFSPDGSILAGGGAQPNTVVLWDTSTGQEILTLPSLVAPVRSLAFSPDGTLIARAGGNFDPRSIMPNEIVLSEVATGRIVATLASGREPFTSIAISPDGMFLATGAFTEQNGVRLWDMTTRSAARPLDDYAADVLSISFSPLGGYVAGGSRDETLRVWDVTTGAQILTLDNRAGPVRAVAWSPDGTYLAAGGSSPTGVTLWDVKTGDDAGLITTPLYCTTFSLTFSPDGKSLIGGLGDNHGKTGAVLMWDVTTGQVRGTLFSNIESPGVRDGVIYAVAITKDGRTVAAGGGDRAISLWIAE